MSSLPFIIGEEEGPVLAVINFRNVNRSPQRVTILMLAQHGDLGTVEKAARVQGVVASEIKRRTVHFIGARAETDVHLVGSASEFGGVSLGLLLKLLDSVDGGHDGGGLEIRIVVGHAIQQVGV